MRDLESCVEELRPYSKNSGEPGEDFQCGVQG